MPPQSIPATPLRRVEREALAGEILGSTVVLRPSAGIRRTVEGTVVDESLSTLLVRETGRTRPTRVPKAGLEGTIVLGAGELPLRGESLRVRPEDRTKRLLTGGPRRFR
ncbi:MAG TPA: ribonuclease P protein subunit [Thermoplasmata archaeon]|jgi:RNase P/RNase MRP subunit p29|nr:ribonuclease P protein subunit [Thermoplasmata archaeon]